MRKLIGLLILSLTASACTKHENAKTREADAVERQQLQYEKSQPIPVFDWSLERELLIELYRIRNEKVITHSVWRANYGMVEGDCPSLGYGLPYDLSLTNPLTPLIYTYDAIGAGWGQSSHTVEQPEPNGVFSSKNTSATWVMCIGEGSNLEPVYVETKVTVYPGPVKVDYNTNRVVRSGAATVLIPAQ